MPLEALNQMSQAFVQDWLNKMQNERALKQLMMQQEGWLKYQEAGSALDMAKLMKSNELQKEALFLSKILDLPQMDDPSSIRAMEIINAISPATVNPALKALVPGMRSGSDILSSSIPALLKGNFEGQDFGSIIRSAGGMQNVLRLLAQGGDWASLQEQLPGSRLNAAANYLQAKLTGAGRTTGQVTPLQVTDHIIARIDKTQARINEIYKNWLPARQSGSADMVLQALSQMMPELQGKDPKATENNARDWINKVGLEFFDDLQGMLQRIGLRADTGEITKKELQLVSDAASPYALGERFGRMRDSVIEALAKRYGKTREEILNLAGTDPQFKRILAQETWDSLYSTWGVENAAGSPGF